MLSEVRTDLLSEVSTEHNPPPLCSKLMKVAEVGRQLLILLQGYQITLTQFREKVQVTQRTMFNTPKDCLAWAVPAAQVSRQSSPHRNLENYLLVYCLLLLGAYFTSDFLNVRIVYPTHWERITHIIYNIISEFILQNCCCLAAKLCPTLCNPVDYSPTGSSAHKNSQVRMLLWVAMPSSRGIFPTQGSNPHLQRLLHWQVGGFFTTKPLLQNVVFIKNVYDFMCVYVCVCVCMRVFVYIHVY